ncbi:type I DNA topoisomerase [Henriciella mobilis]|uniref:type I DNA topoisomerase n=1 Tax=Henriciella mobilis TaxID=2305467 RepID=UPI000E66F5ED|nr:type I DNA topoisomerase [Henriciella mobilis]RIJ15634.1 type I DNA topoisomerase [Henriciella mobilis]RIJ19098.1 type I DNA topoisomerase [Henriciella mobilis]
MKVVVVESPAKAKTINKYLGKDYKVLASYGHVRDLPSKDGSVDPDNDFEMVWQADSKSASRIREIAEATKSADKLILATDPDREGEAISWHLLEALEKRRALKGIPVERVVFNAITKNAVTNAMDHPREIDQELVDAYLARRALDYLVGFNLSPVLWRKLPGSRSAGRVQSVALRLICQRELEIETFVAQEYWSIEADLRATDGTDFKARLHALDGKTLKKFDLPDEKAATAALEAVKVGGYSVSSVESKPVRRNPPPPFITSTLQQEASRKLGFTAKRTMQAAQKLYEEGRITYMRTDGVNMAEEAYHAARKQIEGDYGARYLPEKPRRYSSKAKNAQEAHEAIRPTDFSLRPEAYRGDGDLKKLYTLVWRRAVASQMEPAEFERTTLDFLSKDKRAQLRATGQVIVFDGFIKLYTEGRDDGDDDEDSEGRLPKMKEGEHADLKDAKSEQHFTQPPPRYTEASLVKRLEELGIGRPSTYASTLSTLEDREYVRLDQKKLIPEDKGRLVTAFLENFFARYVEYDFTAELEEKLDVISDGKLDWKAFLRDFWVQFQAAIADTKELRVSDVLDALNEALGPYVFPKVDENGNVKENPRLCPLCNEGELSLKLGRHGAFVGCSRYPDCKFTRPFSADNEKDGAINPEGEELGLHPDTGEPVLLKTGRFGPFVETSQGEDEKPRRTSLPKGWEPQSINLERALKLLSLPREVGKHPEDGEPIIANLGRYGPYVQHQRTFANVPNIEELFDIGLNRATTLIADKKASRGGGRAAVKPLKELGKHPGDDEPIHVYEGRYGPYVKHGKTNATLPKETTPETVTLEQAIELINAKAKKKPAKKKPAAKKKAPAKKKSAAKAKD